LTIIGTTLLASSMMHSAAAAERHRSHRVDRVMPPLTEQTRGANAYYVAPYVAPWARPDWSNADGHAISAPAGVN
jgi:hypothetical protein